MKPVALAQWLASDREQADVPCGDCNACCRSSYFIHVEPDESAALAAIPAALLFPAPGLPPGHRVMGFSDQGHCPMLHKGRCSIYSARPRACRRYDCRVFAVASVDPGADKPLVRNAVEQWQIDAGSDAMTARLGAARTAAAFLQRHAAQLPDTGNPGARALLAISLADLFVDAVPSVAAVAQAIAQRAEDSA